MLKDHSADTSETPCAGVQVQAVAQQSLEEVARELLMDVTRSTEPAQQFLNLLQAGQFLPCNESLDAMLSRHLQNIVTAMAARRGAVVLIDSKTGKMNLAAVYPRQSEPSSGRFFSQTLAMRCLRTGQSLLCADVINDPELFSAKSVIGTYMSSMICALIRSPRRYLGILHLDRGASDEPFTRDDLRRADTLAASMSFALENAQQLQEKQQNLFIQMVIAFSQVIELRDPATAGHAQRVTDYALLLAEELKLGTTDLDHLRIGAPLHDIGKIGIDDAILRKIGRLTALEFECMKTHTVKGAAIVQTLPGLDVVLPIVRNHHERWDGGGYPDRLAGYDIPLLARIMAVADSFDAMTMDRPYRAGMPLELALAEIERCAGTQFDPDCARAFLRLRKVLHQHLSQGSAQGNTLPKPDFLACAHADDRPEGSAAICPSVVLGQAQ
jgi:putative nucleotidyltransferase with HDIG domain